MKEFLVNYGGYILGFVLAPVTWKIFEEFKKIFKYTIHKNVPQNNIKRRFRNGRKKS